jgi:hypothetical protein
VSLTRQSADDVVSPELVLVDPELAHRARPIALTGAWTPAVNAAAIRARSRAAARPAATSLQRVETLPRRPSLPRVAIAAAGAAGCFLVLTTLGGAREYHPGAVPHQAPVKHVATTLPAPKRTLARPTSTPKARRADKAQLVKWRRARFATFYRVVLIRDGAHRLKISTTRTALAVASLRSGRGLRAGRYHWFVRPGYGNPRFRKVPGRTFYGPVTSRGVLLVRRPN